MATSSPTKLEMARFIVQVLYNMKELPAPTHWKVRRMARGRKDALKYSYELSQRAAAKVAPGSTPRSPIHHQAAKTQQDEEPTVDDTPRVYCPRCSREMGPDETGCNCDQPEDRIHRLGVPKPAMDAVKVVRVLENALNQIANSFPAGVSPEFFRQKVEAIAREALDKTSAYMEADLKSWVNKG